MKDRKSLFLLIFTLIVVSISFILISIWGYHFYFAKDAGRNSSSVQMPLRVPKMERIDSLQSLLNLTVQQVAREKEGGFDSTTDTTLALKLLQFNKLKDEIEAILKNQSHSNSLPETGQKLAQLQESIDELRNQNNEVAEENVRLSKIIQQLLLQKEKQGLTSNANLFHSNTLLKSAAWPPLLVSHLKLTGVTEDGSKETNIAALTSSLSGSFQIRVKPNNHSKEIYVVVIQPDGKILISSRWQPGAFETTSGIKQYSAIIHLDGNGKSNRLNFSIGADHFQKGVYTLQVYHLGIMIGRMTHSLY